MKDKKRSQLLKRIRTNIYGFTQKDLASLLGIDKNTVARLERNELSFTKATIAHIGHMLRVDAKDQQVFLFLCLWEEKSYDEMRNLI